MCNACAQKALLTNSNVKPEVLLTVENHLMELVLKRTCLIGTLSVYKWHFYQPAAYFIFDTIRQFICRHENGKARASPKIFNSPPPFFTKIRQKLAYRHILVQNQEEYTLSRHLPFENNDEALTSHPDTCVFLPYLPSKHINSI